MLSKLSIRAKIVSVIAILLIITTGMGAFAISKMSAINANTTDLGTNWLPSIKVLGELRANTLMYRVVVRSHILATTEAAKAAQVKSLDNLTSQIAENRRMYEAMISSPEERAIYNKFSETWD